MTTELKTYSRARAAKAALQAILDMHEAVGEITTHEMEPGRFHATATIKGTDNHAADEALLEDIAAAGHSSVYAPVAKEPAIIDMGEAGDATPYPAPQPTDEELADEISDIDGADLEESVPVAAAPKNAGGYKAETSTAATPTKAVWAIADSMPSAARKDVIEACRQAGIAYGTARTQYQKWFKAKNTAK